MPTQEQRITSLEQFQRETIAAVREQNEHITALWGIVPEQQKDIKRILLTLEDHTASLKVIEQALSTLIGEVRDIKAIVMKGSE